MTHDTPSLAIPTEPGAGSEFNDPLTPLPPGVLEPLTDVSRFQLPDEYRDEVGRTMFDTPGAQDGSITVLLPREEIAGVPLQSLVRITSPGDGRRYLGIVVSGPFAEPDGLRADANVIVATAVRGGIFMPRYHGRVQVELLGEEVEGQLLPPRFRPLPNSPVHVLGLDDKRRALRADGNLRLGVALGDEELDIGVPSDRKSVLPRHVAVLGTTGGGKSTTIGTLVSEAQRAGIAVVLLDTEGEYVHLAEPSDDVVMRTALARRGLEPAGVPDSRLYHLTGTETANPGHPRRQEFGLDFSRLSPYTVAEITAMSDAQQERFLKVFDIGRQVLRDLGIFPRPRNEGDERRALELNEFEVGYPHLSLALVLDLVNLCITVADKGDVDDVKVLSAEMRTPQARTKVIGRIHAAKPYHVVSWRALAGKLWQLHRLHIFDQPQHPPLRVTELLRPGRVSIVDLSGTDSPTVNNIVIADLLRRLQIAQDKAYKSFEADPEAGVRPALVVVEEAHEFLSAHRIAKMPFLFEQVSRIAKRGRKRWLGLVFVTQLPQHLPREVLGLVNNHVLHKINDDAVIRDLRHVIPGIDESLWRRLPALAPGQAVVSFTHMTRPLLVSIDPSPARLRMID
jgi:uncharacterized protein